MLVSEGERGQSEEEGSLSLSLMMQITLHTFISSLHKRSHPQNKVRIQSEEVMQVNPL